MKTTVWAAALTLMLGTLLAGCSRSSTPVVKSGLVADLTDATFDAAIASGVVLVDFWAPWCPPCRTQGPIVEDVAREVEGRARVAKLDVDQAKAIAQRYKIQSIPTLIVFKDGQSVKQFVGVTQAKTLVASIDTALR